jgi:hypothetical protein
MLTVFNKQKDLPLILFEFSLLVRTITLEIVAVIIAKGEWVLFKVSLSEQLRCVFTLW